jgi:hypothetical protein
MSFFKQNSNAKRMNELTFSINTIKANILSEINIRSTKVNKTLALDKNELNSLNILKTKNSTILNYYTEILLIKKALDWIFEDTETEYHKYISINISCCNIYCINTINEWLDLYYGSQDQKELKYFGKEIYTIYDNLKKCKSSCT